MREVTRGTSRALAVAGLVLATIFGFAFFRGRGGKRNPDGELEGRLWSLAERRVAEAGFSFEPAAASEFRQLIGESILRAGGPERRLDQVAVQRIERAYDSFVTEVIEEARRRRSPVIDWGLIEWVKKRICPIWPIC